MPRGLSVWPRGNFANTREQAAAIEFDDDFIYHEIEVPVRTPDTFVHHPHPEGAVFAAWRSWEGRKP